MLKRLGTESGFECQGFNVQGLRGFKPYDLDPGCLAGQGKGFGGL